jgi:hypothetical protein
LTCRVWAGEKQLFWFSEVHWVEAATLDLQSLDWSDTIEDFHRSNNSFWWIFFHVLLFKKLNLIELQLYEYGSQTGLAVINRS